MRLVTKIETEAGKMIISCPNNTTKKRLGALSEEICSALDLKEISLVIAGTSAEENTKTVPAGDPQLHLPMHISTKSPRLRPNFNFANFFVGNFNSVAYHSAMALIDEKQKATAPVFIFSEPGLGKTHLAQAICASNHSACYITAPFLMDEVVYACSNGGTGSIRKRFAINIDLLVVDEVQSLSGKNRTQEELCYITDTILDRGKKIIFLGMLSPGELLRISDPLLSRFQSSTICSITRPDLEDRFNLIQKKASVSEQVISDEVIDILARRLSGDVRVIEGCITSMLNKATFSSRPIDTVLAEEIIEQFASAKKKDPASDILKVVTSNFNLKEKDLFSKSRQKKTVMARQICMFFLREQTNMSLKAIGEIFNRDHATVAYAITEVQEKINHLPSFLTTIAILRKQIT
ncbi:MAG: DnaA/Hda family protein [Candidatus Moraniibacteriota bacterium]